jgi:hypothetical protein
VTRALVLPGGRGFREQAGQLALMDYFPGLGPAVNRLSGASKLMASVADYREAARTQPACHDNA